MSSASPLASALARSIDEFYSALNHSKRPIELYMPHFDGCDVEAIEGVLASGWVAMGGEAVACFEKTIAEYVGVSHAVATVNATAALHLSLILSGTGSNDAVITQSNTFVAPANAIRYSGAEPIFVDIDPDDLGMSPVALERFLHQETELTDGDCIHKATGRRIKAVVPVHVLGHPVDMTAIVAVAHQHRLIVIEDAAEALGSSILVGGHQKRCGSLGDVGVLSFNANKFITTGAGGMLLTDDEVLAQQARHLSRLAKTTRQDRNEFDGVGYNYGMPNLNAALGLAQWKKFDELWAAKQALNLHYETILNSFPEASLVSGRATACSNQWMNAVVFEAEDAARGALAYLRSQSIMARGLWQPLHQSAAYQDCPRDSMQHTDSMTNRVILLPSGIPAL